MKTHFIFILIIVIFYLPNCFLAQKGEIKFEKIKWKQVLEKAKKENKMIYLDCYTSWCGPCKWMKKNVFTNDSVADFYNANFINVEMDMEKGEGFDIAKKYNVFAYPYMLYINADGTALHKTCGVASPKIFVENGRAALSPEQSLTAFEKLFNNGDTKASVAYKYFVSLENAAMPLKSDLEKYFATQNDSSLISPGNWDIILRYASYSSKAYKYFEQSKSLFAERYTNKLVDQKINSIYAGELASAYLSNDKKAFENLKIQFRNLKTKDAEKVIDHIELKLRKQSYADSKNAIEIQDSIVGPINVSLGYGLKRELAIEDNSAWFKLKINYDTLLTFDIVPIDSIDDYDFTFFKCEGKTCDDFAHSNPKQRDRTCLSYCISKSGTTGLSKYASLASVGVGPGPAYASGIKVKKGETYYLMVTYPEIYMKQVKKPLGFTIYFYNYWPKRVPIPLNNIFFESNKAILLKESYTELDKLAIKLMKGEMVIEIRGHTDNQGDEFKNKELSEKRAIAVVEYLKLKGIKPARLFYKGLGSSKPIASNETEDGRKKNRRVEFVVAIN